MSATLCFTVSGKLGTLEPDLHILIVIGPRKKRKKKFCLLLKIMILQLLSRDKGLAETQLIQIKHHFPLHINVYYLEMY